MPLRGIAADDPSARDGRAGDCECRVVQACLLGPAGGRAVAATLQPRNNRFQIHSGTSPDDACSCDNARLRGVYHLDRFDGFWQTVSLLGCHLSSLRRIIHAHG